MSDEFKAGNAMMAGRAANVACKCLRCNSTIAAFDDSFACMYCGESYCPSCQGYTKYFDMEELAQLIK
jgi:hypothetical protein